MWEVTWSSHKILEKYPERFENAKLVSSTCALNSYHCIELVVHVFWVDEKVRPVICLIQENFYTAWMKLN